MLKASFLRVREGQLDRLRWWMGELNRRRVEVRQTFAQESVRHEVAYLLHGSAGAVLVYVMEAEDFDQARRGFQASTLPIDLQHKRVMSEVTVGPEDVEVLYECRLTDP